MKEGEGEKFLPPVQALRELAAFIMSGMSYGWQFSYTPYDKKRNVTENFELVPISAVSPKTKRLRLMEPQVRYPYLYCWSEYTLFEDEARRREHWMSISFATVQGSGNGERKKELSGVYDAYKNAALQAVRNYVRKREKNKPKEIIGEMIIRENPRLFVDSGKFTAEIRVNIYIKEIIPYTIF
ncbi:hypothetical protein [Treponema phagedenis]|nr:hypothetical protein [Treponema phagedenis]